MVKEARRSSDGKYHIQGKKYDMLVGSRAQVMHGTAYKTGYGKKGLKKSQLKMHRGRVVSVKASNRAKSKKNPLAKYIKMAKSRKGKKFVPMKKTKGNKKKSKAKTKKSKSKSREMGAPLYER